MDDEKKVEPHEEMAELDDELTLTDEDKKYFESGGQLSDEAAAAEASAAGEEGAEGEKPAGEAGAGGEQASLEAGAEAGPEQDGDGKQRMVPHGALHAEREEHKKTKAELATIRENQARLDERLKLLTDLHKPPEEAEEVPDPEIDLPGYVQHLEGRVAKAEKTTAEVAETTQQDRQQQQETSDLQTAYVTDAKKFVSEQPDFGDAYQFLIGSRAKEFEVTGATDPVEIAKAVQQDEMQVVRQALIDGESPSKRLYELAKLRGYTPPSPEQTDGNGSAENGAQEANAKSEAAEKLKKVAEAQEANRSLSQAGGAAGGELTAEALAEMSEEEFQEVYLRLKKENPKQLQELMM